ncbi:hypothetical protein SERLADRAFT_371300 [Serpula lacrymans var. lacrymans S7.9]|uniref:Uncharacterized protein n=1 Tax=Serpula lacrymans var. lacrymans (strain S7.9) TaxID=578457 RepID=F8P1L8_SERL9|nr:uncharacterized protein SERLADRAFT_371300 [Serpula lacrymans var. lacrymans S7.9]EGO23047.1 hypothetical protein SERLADRAFT_371300 [Serpula lacrymans var. lacrymans S7.9]
MEKNGMRPITGVHTGTFFTGQGLGTSNELVAALRVLLSHAVHFLDGNCIARSIANGELSMTYTW